MIRQATYVQHQAGFTLLEMLVVLVLISLVTAAAYPAFSGLSSVTPEKIARQSLQFVQLTRLNALSTGQPKALHFDMKNRTISSEATGEILDVPVSMPFSVVIGRDNKTTREEGSILFFPNGGSTGGAIRFGKADDSATSVVVQWLTGSARIEKAGGE